MAKTLNHYSQQIRLLAPDALALDRARELGILLNEAKAAVIAAGLRWGKWLDTDCALSSRTAHRFMAIASRWDEPAFAEARQSRPGLPLREADKVLAASSTRKRPAPEPANPRNLALSKLAVARFEVQLLSEIPEALDWAGAHIAAAADALTRVYGAIEAPVSAPPVPAPEPAPPAPAPRDPSLPLPELSNKLIASEKKVTAKRTAALANLAELNADMEKLWKAAQRYFEKEGRSVLRNHQGLADQKMMKDGVLKSQCEAIGISADSSYFELLRAIDTAGKKLSQSARQAIYLFGYTDTVEP